VADSLVAVHRIADCRRLEEDIVAGGIVVGGIAEGVLRRSIVG